VRELEVVASIFGVNSLGRGIKPVDLLVIKSQIVVQFIGY